MFLVDLLAVQWEQYHPVLLKEFRWKFYTMMEHYQGSIIEKNKKILPVIERYH